MARSVTIGNGSMLVGFDDRGQVRDLYYPFVGEANHVSGASGTFVHRIGVYADGRLSWLSDRDWTVKAGGKDSACVGSLFAENKSLGIELSSLDAVHNEKNILIRHFSIKNTRGDRRVIKLFLAQQFRIHESRRGDTGFYDPRVGAIVHYKGTVTILVNAQKGKKQFSEYSIGLFGIEGKEGSYMDAEDGILSNNPIEHGSVDSVLGLTFELEGESTDDAHYWIACGDSMKEAHALNQHVLEEKPERLLASTEAFWHAWLEKEATDISFLSPQLQSLYKRSLMIMRVHTDNNGGIIASSDTEMLHHGRDGYMYVWPRDAAVIAHAFDKTGYHEVAARFFEFMNQCIEPDGYLMHKYRSDGVLGSSWHSWMNDGEPRLPIQEDETAAVLFYLWEHYKMHRDIEFIETLYNTLIEPAAEFLCDYIDPILGLPKPSFDLWEEKYGTSTYTASCVYGGLMAASKFASTLGKDSSARTYEAVASRIKSAINQYLFNEEQGIFIKQLNHDENQVIENDCTLDSSSFYGPLLFGVLDVDDEKLTRTFAAIEDRLRVRTQSEGYIRYENDGYYRMHDAASPNPWVITTLWIARYHIEKAKSKEDLVHGLEILEWTGTHATVGGVLAEQMHPETREQLSTAPLVWSHAEFVLAVHAYLEKLAEFETK